MSNTCARCGESTTRNSFSVGATVYCSGKCAGAEAALRVQLRDARAMIAALRNGRAADAGALTALRALVASLRTKRRCVHCPSCPWWVDVRGVPGDEVAVQVEAHVRAAHGPASAGGEGGKP